VVALVERGDKADEENRDCGQAREREPTPPAAFPGRVFDQSKRGADEEQRRHDRVAAAGAAGAARTPTHLASHCPLVDRDDEEEQRGWDRDRGEPAARGSRAAKENDESYDRDDAQRRQERRPEVGPERAAQLLAEGRAVDDSLEVGRPDLAAPAGVDGICLVGGEDRYLGRPAQEVGAEDHQVPPVADRQHPQCGDREEEPDTRAAQCRGEDEERAERRPPGRPGTPEQQPKGREEHVPGDIGGGVDRLEAGDGGEDREGREGAAQVGIAEVAGRGEPDREAAQRDDDRGENRDRRRGVLQRQHTRPLADQPRHDDEIARIGGEDRVGESVEERRLQEDRTVLRPERVERGQPADAKEL